MHNSALSQKLLEQQALTIQTNPGWDLITTELLKSNKMVAGNYHYATKGLIEEHARKNVKAVLGEHDSFVTITINEKVMPIAYNRYDGQIQVIEK